MGMTLEGLFYITGGIIRMFDLTTDLWYIYTLKFHEEWLYYASCFAILCPSMIFLLLFIGLAIKDLTCAKFLSALLNLSCGVLLAVLEPIGLFLCLFGFILLVNHSKKKDFYIIETVTRTSGFIEGAFESLPQLIIQSYNNLENSLWDVFTITSICFSVCGFLYTCLKLIYALDRVRQFEQESLEKKGSMVENVIIPTTNEPEYVVNDFDNFE